MKKNLKLAILIGGLTAIPAFILTGNYLRKQNKQNLESKATGKGIKRSEKPVTKPPRSEKLIYTAGPVSPTGQALYDFKDANNLIFCEETQLNKRLIQLENSINIRDIGGYTGYQGGKVKWRKVLRSEELAHLSDRDVEFFKDLKLQHVFDFRNEEKAKKQVDRLPDFTRYHLNPIFDPVNMSKEPDYFTQPGAVDQFMRGIYKLQTEEKAQEFAYVLKYLTAPHEYPLLYHCTNGKDRTGFMTYLILSILGVKEDTIMSDYTLTNLTFDESYHLLGNIMSEELGIDNHHLWEFYGVKPDWLQISIDYITDKFGTVEEYLLYETDLTKTDFKKIRDNLLE